MLKCKILTKITFRGMRKHPQKATVFQNQVLEIKVRRFSIFEIRLTDRLVITSKSSKKTVI